MVPSNREPTRPCTALRLLLPALLLAPMAAAADLAVSSIEPTPLFVGPDEGQPLRQRALLHLTNPDAPIAAVARVTVGRTEPYTEELGGVPTDESTWPISILDIPAPTDVTVEVLAGADGRTLASQRLVWQPQRKWRIFCVSYSHHDLGFGNYPHRLRTEIRHANIERPLQFCRETDGWDEDSRFRFVVETSEPITSFLGSHSQADAAELGRRIREGRIQIGAVHNTANTEQLSHELLARLFYLTERHTRDLLGVPASKTAQIDDVIGLTWPLATYCAAAGVPYFFHGHNACADCLQPASAEPVFWWQGPGGVAAHKVLMHSRAYGMGWDSLGAGDEAAILRIVNEAAARGWPYDALLSQDGTDFTLVTLDNATKIRDWNAKYAYPHLVCATMDMFFDAIAEQADPAAIKTFAKDGNNQWADQDATDAVPLGMARRLGEGIPTAEKLATIATALAGGGYPWTDIYQAYHRLLAYHEHTDAIDAIAPVRERMQQYETELEENREMVTGAAEFCDRARDGALAKLTGLIATKAARSIVVFNPLARSRTDVVRLAAGDVGPRERLVDAATGRAVWHQPLPDGSAMFLAADVPATGYRTYSVVPTRGAGEPPAAVDANVLESRFYRIQFDAQTGAIVSIHDKQLGVELVDQAAPHRFNEYLYERFGKPTPEEGSTWYRVESAQLSAQSGPVAEVMTVRARAVGVESLTQTVILYRSLKRIDFALGLVKSPSGRTSRTPNTSLLNKESLYVALPFAVPDLRLHHELPGGVAEPMRDQFGGSCTAYYAARHFADVSNDRFGVTVSSPEVALFEYDRARSCPISAGRESMFEMAMEYPRTSRMYLYLLDNMFDVNIRWDQRGPMRFTWSVRSHEGDWRKGQADAFGWDTLNPLLPKLVVGAQRGSLPPVRSFMSIDAPNIVCTTVKPAEANGVGLILRFVETRGIATSATVSLPFIGRVSAATETDLVENDLPVPLPVTGDRVSFAIDPFGVKTIRVLARGSVPVPTVSAVRATPVSDMQVELAWRVGPGQAERLSHYNVYRGVRPDFRPSLLCLIGRPATTRFTDQPTLNYGGWINSRLEPNTTYYYRVSAVDRWNNEGPLSPAVRATTLTAREANRPPLPVEGLRAILVSPLSRDNYVNLLFRTNCESDVGQYEVHRSTQSSFTPDESTRIGVADADAKVPGSGGYGHVPIEHRAGDYDHIMYQDDTAQPDATYCYRVCAVDTAGQRGPFSREASARTKPAVGPLPKTDASSVYAPQYGPDNAIDGSPDPEMSWISKPYGGGTPEKPADAWWTVEFPAPVRLRGVTIIGDYRAVIPFQRTLRIDYRSGGEWETVATVGNATEKTIRAQWAGTVETSALRIYVPAPDLPKSTLADIPDGVVRLCELLLLLPDGREVSVPDMLGQ